MPPSAPAHLLRTVLKLIAIGFVALFMGFLLTPGAWERREPPRTYLSEVLSAQASAPEPDEAPSATATPTLPRAISTLDVHIGPGSSYVIIGSVPRGARLEVVGRDALGQWLAIVFSFGSKLNGWVPNDQVAGVADISTLPLAPVTFLPTR